MVINRGIFVHVNVPMMAIVTTARQSPLLSSWFEDDARAFVRHHTSGRISPVTAMDATNSHGDHSRCHSNVRM